MDADKAYLKNLDAISECLQTDLKNGLSETEVEDRLAKFGPNILKQAKGPGILSIFLSQFINLLIIILLIAALISLLLGEKIDAIMIMAIVLINAIVGFIQEYKVEKAIEHLKKLVTTNAKVYRDGKLLEIPSSDLVPGDLIVIEEGTKIPADIRIIQAINLQTIEAPLTGESTPITKTSETLKDELPIADQKNMLFSATIVSVGKGTGIVVATGMDTQIGKIAHLVQSETSPPTPMQVKLDRLGGLIGKIVLIIAAVIGLEEMVFGGQKILDALISAVALAVAAIPEGLPAVVTISLALGTKRLLKQKALIRNLPAAETLGSTDVICCDKTGTLTEGTMQVRRVYINGKIIDLSTKDDLFRAQIDKLLKFGFLASNARASNGKIIGDTTEAALIQAALNAGFNQNELDKNYPRLQEIPFSSDRKMVTTLSQEDDHQLITSKGAVEVILDKCTKIEMDGKVRNITQQDRQKILKSNNQMAENALRVLAFAYKTEAKEPEKDLIFLGLQGMMDPPKRGVTEAVQTCQKAGIKVIMITGDHLLTAQAVAKEINITGEAITGVDLDKLSDQQFEQKVGQISIYARVNPEHKIKIVKALKAHGHQVAMTGDGVNDAPALSAADIGVAMGITGTDVAKDASDIVLLDDHFSTIVTAVKEGRGIYENIRKFVGYLLSANTMEVAVIFISVVLGWPLPLLPIHLLWINLVTDGLPAVALGIDPTRGNIMDSKPAQFREEIINKKFIRLLLTVSSIITVAILGIFGLSKDQLVHAQTLVFTAVVLYEFLVIVAIRSEYNLGFLSNKYLNLAVLTSLALHLLVLYLPLTFDKLTLQQLFKVQPLNLFDWGVLTALGVILYILMHFTIMKPLTKTSNFS